MSISSEESSEPFTLASLPPGETAVITEIDEKTPLEVRRRLQDLGFRRGAKVEFIKRAPLGDPTIYRVSNYDMCLRAHEASIITCVHLDTQLVPREPTLSPSTIGMQS